MSARILVIDDETSLRELLRIVLEGEGYQVKEAATYAEAAAALKAGGVDLAICDIFLPDGDGLNLVRTFHPVNPRVRFIVVTAHTTPSHALHALREGAVEYLSKPFDVEELKLVVAKQLDAGSEQAPVPGFHDFIGQSPAMWPILERIPQVARSDATLLISGDSGTGKELLARAIHASSPRAARDFVPVNCGALPEGLLESELFGHVRGSFTGATRDKRGLMQEAEGGTLFLDEIGELALNTQVKLLRALQEHTIRPVGDNREVEVDLRIIAATNQDLRRLVETARFREDLYYRINVIHMHLPPLRERREDIPALVRHFVERVSARDSIPVKQVHRDAMAVLESYAWPGNVRELENVIERTVAMEPSRLVTVSSLPPTVLGTEPDRRAAQTVVGLPEDGLDLEAHLDGVRREIMREALVRCRGVQKDAAALLRMSYRAFRYHAEKFKLTGED